MTNIHVYIVRWPANSQEYTVGGVFWNQTLGQPTFFTGHTDVTATAGQIVYVDFANSNGSAPRVTVPDVAEANLYCSVDAATNTFQGTTIAAVAPVVVPATTPDIVVTSPELNWLLYLVILYGLLACGVGAFVRSLFPD